jgi:hypothetical protein
MPCRRKRARGPWSPFGRTETSELRRPRPMPLLGLRSCTRESTVGSAMPKRRKNTIRKPLRLGRKAALSPDSQMRLTKPCCGMPAESAASSKETCPKRSEGRTLLAEKGVRGKGQQPLSPPQRTVARGAPALRAGVPAGGSIGADTISQHCAVSGGLLALPVL